MEYAWMATDAVGRSEIRASIAVAEQILFNRLTFWPAPRYSIETRPWPRYYVPGEYRVSRIDTQGRFIGVQLEQGYIQKMGVEKLDLIETRVALTYSDEDSDGLKETWTATVATTITDPVEIAAYFVSGDRLIDDAELSARWRIEPVKVTITAGTATIRGKRWLVVKPVLYESAANYPIASGDDSKFITTIDVYRRYTYTEGVDSAVDSQSALIWESRPCLWGCDCSSLPSSTDPAAEGWVAGRAGIRNTLLGEVRPAEAVYDAVTGVWSHPDQCFSCCGEPDKVLLRFLAGYPLSTLDNWVDKSMRTLITRLSAAEMNHRICGCDAANREWTHWQFDVSRVEGPETYQAGLDVLNNPLGTRRGHIYAWQQILDLARVVGILI